MTSLYLEDKGDNNVSLSIDNFNPITIGFEVKWNEKFLENFGYDSTDVDISTPRLRKLITDFIQHNTLFDLAAEDIFDYIFDRTKITQYVKDYCKKKNIDVDKLELIFEGEQLIDYWMENVII